ncbi:unnamed protein product [Gordionus sp. m RMFG-2023]|uniref:uncharacterized protein LOC135926855 n=1 Tax=Gordionus sp. m RMFG-2023 TaxID=3053472 RepID=UPI0030E5B7D9
MNFKNIEHIKTNPDSKKILETNESKPTAPHVAHITSNVSPKLESSHCKHEEHHKSQCAIDDTIPGTIYTFDRKHNGWQERSKNRKDNDLMFHLDTNDGKFKFINEQEMLVKWQQRWLGEDLRDFVKDYCVYQRKSEKSSKIYPNEVSPGKHI